jgi:hypothetical protein
MKSFRAWGPVLVAALLLLSFFQNCSPVSFKQAVESPSLEQTGIVQKTCDLEKKNEGETWMSAAGQTRDMVACLVGVGNQFQVFNLSKEYICTNGTATLTGKEERTPAGLEGLCNLDCGTHKNGELWWIDLNTSKETMQCPTSLTATSTVTYQNLAEYKCTNAVASATGNTSKKRLDETACPPLTFNDQDNQATLAYEDIYPTPLDSDYNDFVTNIKVSETYSSLGELTKIVIDYTPKHIGGGLAHKLVTVFDGVVRGRDGWVSNQKLWTSEQMFKGAGTIKYELFTGGTLTTSATVAKDADLVVFDRTSTAVTSGMAARITVTGIDGKQNLLTDRKGLSIKRYRTLLYVPDAGSYSTVKRYDIDISDINPSAYDNAGRPLAFFVPVNWKSPLEGISILKGYPDFQGHADYLKNSITMPNLVEDPKYKNWFNNVIPQYVQ